MWALPMMHTRPQHTDPRPGPQPQPPRQHQTWEPPPPWTPYMGHTPGPNIPDIKHGDPLLVTSGGNH